MREDESLTAINNLIPIEERPILDNYVDLLIRGERDAFRQISQSANIKPSALTNFLNSPVRRNYVQSKLAYLLDCAEIDRLKVLQETRDIAFSSPDQMLKPDTEKVYNPATKQFEDKNLIVLKAFDEIPKECWKAVQSLKFSALGHPEIKLHSKVASLQLLAKLQNLHKQSAVQPKDDKPKGLFHMGDAKTPPDGEVTPPEDADNPIIDVELTEEQEVEHQKIINSYAVVQDKRPADIDVIQAEAEKYSSENMYEAF